jgi:FkbM family methyltransferase
MINLREIKHRASRGVKRFGIEVRRAEPELLDFINDRQIDTVWDVGANVGQFGESLRLKGYNGKIVSFEPIRSAYETLAAKATADGNWEAHNFALGAECAKAKINVSLNSVFSSILPATPAALRFDNNSSRSHVEEIEVRTLDR